MSAAALSLLAAAAGLEARVRELVAARRAVDPHPDDPFRGLYLGDEAVDQLLAQPWPVVEQDPVAQTDGRLGSGTDSDLGSGQDDRLAGLTLAAGLTPLDVDLLLVALLPDLDPRFERFYGYLNDDVSRRRASVGLALELAGVPLLSAPARSRLQAEAPLVAQGLVQLEDTERPFLGRALRVPDRVVAHLLGDDAPDESLRGVLRVAVPYSGPAATAVGALLAVGVGLVHLREQVAGTGSGAAVAGLASHGRPAVVLDLMRLDGSSEAVPLLVAAVREALLTGGGLVAGPVEALARTQPAALRRLTASPVPVLLVGSSTWDPQWSETGPVLVDVPAPTVGERVSLWEHELVAAGVEPAGAYAVELAGPLVLGPDQVRRSVGAALLATRAAGTPVGPNDLRRGARGQNAAGLERLARRVEPAVGWSDLVLPAPVERALRDLASRARHRDTVLGDWRMRRGGGRGHGVTALFAGPSGTGKTLSAEVVASDLGLDLYTVNLATVVDKYVGETEKNLERIFSEAGGVNAVLFFDEADAVFGKRSEVKDAQDRYANVESAYLLQRLETFDGLAVLATNLRSNIDDAFTRRLDTVVDFPNPTPQLRRALWVRCLRPPLPVADDLDVGFLADAFELAGGHIASAATSAAYLAVAESSAVTMAHVVAAVEQEYRKLGRLVLEREFGRFHPAAVG